MSSKVIMVCLLVHVATIIGAIVAGVHVGDCADSADWLCGTPVAGFFGQAEKLQPSANPFSFAGGIIKMITVLAKLTVYNYEVLNESDNTVVELYYFVVRAGFVGVWLYNLRQIYGLLAQSVGRFFTR